MSCLCTKHYESPFLSDEAVTLPKPFVEAVLDDFIFLSYTIYYYVPIVFISALFSSFLTCLFFSCPSCLPVLIVTFKSTKHTASILVSSSRLPYLCSLQQTTLIGSIDHSQNKGDHITHGPYNIISYIFKLFPGANSSFPGYTYKLFLNKYVLQFYCNKLNELLL